MINETIWGVEMVGKMDEQSSLGLLRSPIFHKFLVGKKWDTNLNKSGPGAKRVRPPLILGRPGGMRGASGGLQGLLELRIWKKSRIRICGSTRRVRPRGGRRTHRSAHSAGRAENLEGMVACFCL